MICEIIQPMTNEMTGAFSPQATNLMGEVLSYFIEYGLPVIVAALVALLRRSAKKSAILQKAVEAAVRGINSSKETIGEENTQIVKKAVQDKAVEAGVEPHLAQIVDKVRSDPNGLDGGHI